MLKNKLRSMPGFTLIEVIVAVALLAVVGIGLLATLGDATKVLSKADVRESARNLAEAQMEYIQNCPYDSSDPVGSVTFYPQMPNLSTDYPGYGIEVHAARVDKGSGIASDTGLQEITLVVNKGTANIFTLLGMKVKRD
jgi:prepilin-type N-terminal cleavage/methylation domain-containing protein